MAIGDIYMLSDRHKASWGTEMLNVYFYIGSGDGLALDLCQGFADEILGDIAATQTIDINHYLLEAISLFDPTDFGILSVDVDGTQATETSAPFLATNFSFQLPTRAIRKGSKRIGPIPENVVVNGVITDATYIGLLNALTVDFALPTAPTAQPSRTFDPVVVKRVIEGTPPDVTYRLPVSFGEAEYANVVGVTVNLNASHQTSRKR